MTAPDDSNRFGREIADHVVAEIRSVALTIDEATQRQRKVDGLQQLVDRADRAMMAAARGREISGLSRDEAQAWLKRARAGFAERMAEVRQERESAALG